MESGALTTRSSLARTVSRYSSSENGAASHSCPYWARCKEVSPRRPVTATPKSQLPSQSVVRATASATRTVRLVSPMTQPVDYVLHVAQAVRCPAAEQP